MRRICLISDYLTWLITGQHVTEAGAAGLTSLLDIHRCCWWSALCARLEIPQAYLPRVVHAGRDLGLLGDGTGTAPSTGFGSASRPIAASLSVVSINTREPLARATLPLVRFQKPSGRRWPRSDVPTTSILRPAACVHQGPAFPDGFSYQMAVGAVSANYLEWYRGQLPDRPDFDRLMVLASRVERVPATCG